MRYPNLCYNEMCYNRTALYFQNCNLIKLFAAIEDSMTVLEDSDSEEWSSHYFPSASGSTAGKGGKKGGYKKVNTFYSQSPQDKGFHFP